MMVLGLQLVDLAVYRFRTEIAGKAPLDELNPPMSLKELARMYTQIYLGPGRKTFNPYFRFFLQDPLVSLLWWAQYSTYLFRAAKQLGK